MRNLLALVGAVVVVVIGLGWYLGWYQIGGGASEEGKVNIGVNTGKIVNDLKKGGQAVGEILPNGKKVEGTPTGGGGWQVVPNVPTLPSLPAPPSAAPIEYNPDGTPKLAPPPPPR